MPWRCTVALLSHYVVANPLYSSSLSISTSFTLFFKIWEHHWNSQQFSQFMKIFYIHEYFKIPKHFIKVGIFFRCVHIFESHDLLNPHKKLKFMTNVYSQTYFLIAEHFSSSSTYVNFSKLFWNSCTSSEFLYIS